MLTKSLFLCKNTLKNFKSFNLLNKFVPKKNFAGSVEGLRKILKTELEHETQNYSPVDKAELTQFHQNTKFNFSEKENTINMELKKTHGNYDVTVNFQARPPMPQEDTPQQGEGEQEKGPADFTEFLVRVVKKGGKSGLLVTGSTIDNSYEFQKVEFAEDVDELYNNYIQQKQVDIYTGPDFNSLDERLQAEFNDFLSSLGINEELASFINVLAQDKDQRLYKRWLENVNKFFLN
jgi:complement component 1 Q subcomponent-binding protein